MNAIADLLDVNVWLALTLEEHFHHARAMEIWPQLNQPSFCRLTQLGFLRLLCNSSVMGKSVLTPYSAWETYQSLMNDENIKFAEEPAGLDESISRFTRNAKSSRDYWTDLYLGTFAACAEMRMVTFDSGFNRFSGLALLLLKAD